MEHNLEILTLKKLLARSFFEVSVAYKAPETGVKA